MRYLVEIDEHKFRIEVFERADRLEFKIGGQKIEVDWEWLTRDRHLSLLLDGYSYDIKIEPENGELHMYYGGERFTCRVQDERLAELRRLAGDPGTSDGPTKVKAPMPGLILKLLIEPGQRVSKNERLMIIEAMKMENELKAPRDGVVTTIHCTEREAVDQGQVLLVLE